MAFALFRLVRLRNKRGNRVAWKMEDKQLGILTGPLTNLAANEDTSGFGSRAGGKTNFAGLRPSSAALIVIYYRLHRARTPRAAPYAICLSIFATGNRSELATITALHSLQL